MKSVKPIIIILAIILFVSNYSICSYFFYNEEVKNIKEWWYLKSDIYSIIIMILLFALDIGSKKWLKFIISIGLGLTISSVADRLFFNTRVFDKSDIYMILITVAFATYNLIYARDKQGITE
tara:strand:+ start:237 stop:602 length:366 start_codon:yes stop_codon:yes gene_type:complete